MNALIASDRIITSRLRALADSLPAVLEAEPEAVHKARVASRRVREALPVVLAQAPARRAERLRRSFRRVTRALGPLREMDVTLGLLDGVTREDASARPAFASLRAALEHERRARRDGMLARLEEVDFESLAGRIERLMDARSDESDEARALPLAIEGTLGVRVARRVRALEVAVERAGALYAPEALHAVRIASKKLRYTLELASEMRMLPSRRSVTVLKQAQEVLGQLHDDQVLAEWIRRHQASEAAAPDPAAERALVAIENRCRERHARYLSLRVRLLAAAATALEALAVSRGGRERQGDADATVH